MKHDGSPDNISERIKHITGDLKRYAEKRLELMVINIGEQYARWIAESIQRITGMVFLFGGLMFLMVALAFYIGALLNSISLGFIIASIPLFIVGYLFFNLIPESISENLRADFEEELAGIFRADKEHDREDHLLPRELNELEKKNEHHV